MRKGALSFEEAVRRIPLGRWRHFKGGQYEVLGIAKDSETLAPTVVYRALYGDGAIWVRAAQMWLETVVRDGASVARFTFLGEQDE